MNIFLILLILAAVLIVFFTAWLAIPLIVFAFFPASIHSWFLQEAECDSILHTHPLQMETVAELTALGFKLLGARIEKLPLWGVKIPSIAMADPLNHTYAAVLLSARQKPVGVYFFTPFKNGAMLFTRNQSHRPEWSSAGETVANVTGQSLPAVYAKHLSLLEQETRPPDSYFDVLNLTERHTAALLFYRSVYGRRQARKYLATRQVRNFLIIIVVIIVIMVIGLRSF